MITLCFGNNEYQFPNSWEELTPQQYLWLIPLLNKLWMGELSLCEVRLQWFKKLANLDGIKIRSRHINRFADNIYTASRQFNFFFSIDYHGKTDELSAENRRLLLKTPAEDIMSGNSELRYAATLEYTYKPDSVWAKNLIPTITVADRELSGWEVDVDGGALTSSLTALQFLQANDILSIIAHRGRRKDMLLLASILYPSSSEVKITSADYERLPDDILYGIVLNFQALVSFVFTRTPFSILWSAESTPTAKDAIRSSMSESIYGLSKSGYGNYEQIERMPLVTYLSITRADMISSIRSLSDSKIKIDDIAQQTKLPIELIQKIIS